MTAAVSITPHDGTDLVGSVRRIGDVGPPYEVLAARGPDDVRIMVLESGETLDYPAGDARNDPEA